MRYEAEKVPFAIRQGDPIIRIWNSGLEVAVMEIVTERKGWISVDVLRRGYFYQAAKNPVEIIITIAIGATDPVWQDIFRRVRQRCKEADLNLEVDLIEDEVVSSNEDTPENGALVHTPYAERPQISASIGSCGGPSGSLGGYVEVVFAGGEKKVFGLTCHHVALYRKTEVEGQSELGLTKRSEIDIMSGVFKNGLPFNESSEYVVHQPSDDDHHYTLKAHEGILLAHREQESKLAQKFEFGIGTDRDENIRTKLRLRMQEVEADIQKLKSFDRGFGHVAASSGFRLGGLGCNIDWAIVEVPRHRLGVNQVPAFLPFFDSMATDQTSDLTPGVQVAKFSRDGSRTRGEFSFIKSNVNLANSAPSKEWVFVSSGELPFSTPGDSGTFVFDYQQPPAVGGMVIAGHKWWPWTYVTPIKVILDDIGEKLQGRVNLPSYEDP
ncbi:MAG: hypothetical protein M4579_001101 [Chaenotheca gracillima]|nr:MAG: hypothetical protein M4579_001101 [Chaenotheca gracillima]